MHAQHTLSNDVRVVDADSLALVTNMEVREGEDTTL